MRTVSVLLISLLALQLLAEDAKKEVKPQMTFTKKDAPALTLLSVTHKIADFPEIPKLAGEILPKVHEKAKVLGLKETGPEVFIYKFLPEGGMEFLMGVQVNEAKGDGGEFKFITTSPVKVVSCIHKGSMPTIGKSWDALVHASEDEKLECTNESREIYLKWVEFDSPDNETELQRVLK